MCIVYVVNVRVYERREMNFKDVAFNAVREILTDGNSIRPGVTIYFYNIAFKGRVLFESVYKVFPTTSVFNNKI